MSSRLVLRLAEAARESIGRCQQLRCYSAAASSCGAAEARAAGATGHASASVSASTSTSSPSSSKAAIDVDIDGGIGNSLPVAYVFLGAPGVGKGTYSTRVADALGAEHVSAGDLVRAEVKAGTELGKQVSERGEKKEIKTRERNKNAVLLLFRSCFFID